MPLILSALTIVALATSAALPAWGATTEPVPPTDETPSTSTERPTPGGTPPVPAEADSPSADAESAASLEAQAQGHNVEVDSLTTETTLVEALPDGTFQMTSTAVPSRVQRGDGWADIDTSLGAENDGYIAPVATTVPVRFSAGGIGPVAQVQLPSGDWFDESWELGALPAPIVDGPSATYEGVIPDVDLRLTATATGMTEVLVVKTAEAAADPRIERLKLKVSGASIATTPSGGTIAAPIGSDAIKQLRGESPTVDEIDAKSMLHSNEPLAWDSSDPTSGPEGPGGNTVAAPVDAMIIGGETLAVDVASITKNGGTTYPLYIDPDWGSGNIQAWSINQTYPDTHYWNVPDDSDERGNQIVGFLPAGWTEPYPGDGRQQWGRSFWQLSTAGSAGKHIIQARFNVRQSWNSSCASTGVRLFRATSIPSAGASWNESVGVVYNGPSDVVSTNFGSHCDGPSWVGMNATQAVIDNGTGAAIILALAASDETNESWKRFNLDAQLIVTYNNPPNRPANPRLTSPARGCGTYGDPTYVNSNVPVTMAADLSDPDGQNVAGQYRIMEGNNGSINKMTPYTTGYGGAGASWVNLNLATMGLLEDHLYAWGVTTFDQYPLPGGGWGHDASGESLCFFKIDGTPPPAPTITVPAGGATVGVGISGITITSAPSDRVASFAYWWVPDHVLSPKPPIPVFQADPKTVLPACGSAYGGVDFVCPDSSGKAVISAAPITATSTLWVASLDRAGNVSGSTPPNSGNGVNVNAGIDTTNVSFDKGHGWNTDGLPTPLTDLSDSNANTTGSAQNRQMALQYTAGFSRTTTATVPKIGYATPVLAFRGLAALIRSNSGSDHGAFAESTGPGGYRFEQVLGQLGQLENPIGATPPNTKLLYSCILPGGDDMTSDRADCEGTGVTGTRLGYIWTTATAAVDAGGPGAIARQLFRCRVGADHFDSLSSTCEGWASDGPRGWVVNLDKVQTADRPIDTTQSFTVSAWVNPLDQSHSSRYQTIMSQDGASYGGFYLMTTPGGSLRFCMRSQVTLITDCAVAPTATSPNTWVFVTGVWDRANRQIRLYVNKKLVTTNSHSLSPGETTASGRLSVGSAVTNNARTNMWNGYILYPTIFPGVADSSQLDNLMYLGQP